MGRTTAEDEANVPPHSVQSVGQNSTINQKAEGIDVVHDDVNANDAEVDVGYDAQRQCIHEELLDHEIKRLEKLGVRDEQRTTSGKA